MRGSPSVGYLVAVRRSIRLVPLALILALACKPDAPPTEPPVAATPEAAGPTAPPADPDSYWIGSLALPGGKSLDWAIAIAPPADDPNGELVATLWIPEQLLMRHGVGAPVIADDGSIAVTLAAVGATWTIMPGEDPSCEFVQQGMTFDCDLEAVAAEEFAELMTPARPQTPKPPFPYTITEVEIQNPEAAGVTLAGTLTIPEGPGPHPGVVLISGSGLQDRDETIADHKPFWIIADHLSRHGIAVLRYDDRGFARSTGDGASATIPDFASDAHAAIRWLAEQDAIDGDHVGLIGHSEGGVVAPIVASEHPKDVDFIVLLAGTGVTGSALIVHQLGLIMKAGGADDATIAKERESALALHRAVIDSPDLEAAKAAVERELRAQIDALTEAERQAIGDVEKAITTQVEALTNPWTRHILSYDPIPTLKRVRVPTLILFGDKDLQVDPEQNLPPMKKALAKNRAVEVVRFSGLNHLFQPATTGAPSEYGMIEQTIAVEVLERMTTWLRATAGLD